ncbi:MAG: TonB-dependent receptor [Bacteroidota bacterium]
MHNYFTLFITLLCVHTAFAQFKVQGTVVDNNDFPLFGTHVHSNLGHTVTDEEGTFQFKNVSAGTANFQITYMGFKDIDTLIDIDKNTKLKFVLQPKTEQLDEVLVSQKVSSKMINSVQVDNNYIKENFSGSLAKSLERIPGVNAIEVGSGASKPIIRGLSFNRIVVAENGTRHEGQQWGSDHGLEIDAFSTEEVEVVKSVGAIEYGSDAIGGVLKITNDKVPENEGISGEYRAFGRSVSQSIANSINFNYKKDNFFFKFRSSITDYGDYNLPTDTITYLNVRMPVENQRLMNTAGNERNFMTQFGYTTDKFQSILSISNNYSKSGYFPGAHGVPSIIRTQDDGDRRNIDFPYQKSNHLKIISKNKWFFDKSTLIFLMSYQNNNREEWSLFHTHYGNQEPPENNPNQELDFNLNTVESSLKLKHHFSKKHQTTLGIQAQHQNNKIAGFNFLLPEYRRSTLGVFGIHQYDYNDRLAFDLGIRADFAQMNIDSFYDPLLYEYLVNRNYNTSEAQSFAERSTETNRSFSNFNALASAKYQATENWSLSLATGTNFRLPTAIELASNGIHHGSFRHERGNPDLNPEKGIVFDTKVTYQDRNKTFSLNPYAYYFDNYIFLKPTGNFSPLPHGGQINQYTESAAVMSGIELFYEQEVFDNWLVSTNFEYLWNRQDTGNSARDYPLPFSPPINAFAEISYQFHLDKKFTNAKVYLNTNKVWEQDRIAQNERTTPGYQIFGVGVQTELVLGKFKANIRLEGRNLFNEKYFNHTNFYRALEIPEMGRNIQLMIRIPFGNNA